MSPKTSDPQFVKQVFLHHLNRLYFGKQYISKTIGSLIELASFNSLKLALQEFGDDINSQIKRMAVIYELIEETPSDANCNPIKAIVKDKFCLDDAQPVSVLLDTDVLLYVQMLEHINIISCRMLKALSVQLDDKEIEQLLIECFDESIDNDQLFLLITKEYINLD
ncbi:DUF892 family protein [Mucilaginibacter gynuensis]